MVQLSELYRGSKSKAITKSFSTRGLQGYGMGSNYKRHEIERITHAMVFDRILTENSIENNGGFMSDYLSLGENASSLQHGSRKLFVEFPQKTAASGNFDKERKKSSKKRGNRNVSRSHKSKKPTSSKKAKTDTTDVGGLQFMEINSDESDNDDDSMLERTHAQPGSVENLQSVLPHHHTKKLVEKFKTLNRMWAEEEQLAGNNVHCKFDNLIEFIS